MGSPNCRQCKHYFITFEPKTPNGCRKFGMKSKELPSVVVKSAGNGDCAGFEAKPDPKTQGAKNSLNDSKYW